MKIHTLFVLFLIPAMLIACADRTMTDRENTADVGQKGQTTAQDLPDSFSITTADQTMTVQDGRLSITSRGSDGSVGRIQERQLTEDEQEKFKDLLEDVDDLGQNTGSAQVVVVKDGKQMQGNVDPANAPDDLKNLITWIQEKAQVKETGAIGCSDPRPKGCQQFNDPVCGSNKQTYTNGCLACADAKVSSYTSGSC